MRRLLALALLALSSLGFGDTFKVNFTLADRAIGFELWEMQADGTFTSTAELDTGGNKVASKMSGKLEKEKLRSYSMTMDSAGRKIEASWDGAKAKLKVGQASQPDRDLTHPSGAAFSNLHFQLLRTALAAYVDTTGGRQEIEALVPEGGVKNKLYVTRTGSSQIEIRGKPVSVTKWTVEVSIVQMQLVQGEDGRVLGMYVPSQFFKAVVEGFEDVFVDPTTRIPEISQPTIAKFKTDKAVKVPMRDGVMLAADIVRPDAEGKYPVVLSRTPYGRGGMALTGDWWARRGYVLVSQDCRGRGDSDGDWVPFENERKDGYDTIEWLAKQPWCDGNVGMIGGSYGGLVQWAAAVEKPKALKCIIPQVSPPDAFFNIPWDHGIFFLYGNVWWSGIVKEKQAQMSGFSIPKIEFLTTLPLEQVDDKVWGKNIPFFDSWLKRETPKDYPGFDYGKDIAGVRIPVLMISGWFDGDGIGTKLNWEAQRKGGNPNRWLIYGPWTHIFNSSTRIGDQDFGADSVLELDSVYLRFFDTYLKGKKAGMDRIPKVQAFVMGENQWKSLDEWPASTSVEQTLYLGSDGPANGKGSRGMLLDAPQKESEPSRYTYNPAHAEIPADLVDADPSKASFDAGIESAKDDTLVYKSAPFTEATTIIGPIRAEIYFSTSAKDTDFFASIVDVDEKGKAKAVGTGGKIRAKYIAGWNNPKLLTPGKTYKATIELWDTAFRLEKGHRLALMITSSAFPLYSRNLNTGEPVFGATRMVAAHQTIYHDAARPSVLKFRVLKG